MSAAKPTTSCRPMRIPFARAPLNFDDAAPYLKEAIDNGWLTTGPLTERFTAALATELKTPNLVAVSSCTAALQIALAAAELPDGAEVIVPANTFIATFETVELAGLTPVPVSYTHLARSCSGLTPQTASASACASAGAIDMPLPPRPVSQNSRSNCRSLPQNGRLSSGIVLRQVR